MPINLTPLIASFIIITIAELDDNAQFAVIVLSAKHEFPLLIFIEASMAFALVSGLGAVVDTEIMRVVPLKYIQLGSGLVFIVLGIAFLINPA